MKEAHLKRLLNRLVLISLPVPAMGLGMACGSNGTELDSTGSSGAGGSGSPQDGGGGSAGAGSGSGGAAGTTAGAGGYGGSATGGAGGVGGSVTGAGGGSGATGGGGAGGVVFHDAGADAGCQAAPSFKCAPFDVVIARECIEVPDAQVGSILPHDDCARICNTTGVSVLTCSLSAIAADAVTIACTVGCAVGRRPEGLLDGPSSPGPRIGTYFAEVSHLEAASIIAFKTLRAELAQHGAPRRLVRAAARAARDEVRHARMTAALARRFGATTRVPVVERRRVRSLERIATENAVEGCVRETFGALVATWQANRAEDPAVRSAMKRIARDETRHAALSWDVSDWLNGLLDRGARCRVAEARRAAAAELLASTTVTDSEVERITGAPTCAQQRKLAEQMASALWA